VTDGRGNLGERFCKVERLKLIQNQAARKRRRTTLPEIDEEPLAVVREENPVDLSDGAIRRSGMPCVSAACKSGAEW